MNLLVAPVAAGIADWAHAVPVAAHPRPVIALTPIQCHIVQFIQNWQTTRHTAPTYQEISDGVHRHRSAVAYQIGRLVELGVIDRTARSPRAIRLTDAVAGLL